MRRIGPWIPGVTLAALVLALWGLWTWRLSSAQQGLALELEAQRQRSFSDMAHHVEQIQSLLAKGLVTGTVRQNMRYMGDVHHHSQAAVDNFTSLPLPPELSASVGKFLQQVGDFSMSIMRNEAAGREMDDKGRAELARLRAESASLSVNMQDMMTRYNQGNFRWNPPVRLTWATLFRGTGLPGKPATGAQAPASMTAQSWDQVGAAVGKLPVMVYDGPFSDHLGQRTAAMAGPPVSREQAEQHMVRYLPNSGEYRVTGVEDVNGNLPAFSFHLTPNRAPAGNGVYTTVAEVTRNGGHLLQFLNFRMVGKATIDLDRARAIGQEYLESHGYPGMSPTYGQVQDGTATIAYAFREKGVLIYPDQIKVKVALDNGEVLAVDARQFLMTHHTRSLATPTVSAQEAQARLRNDLEIERTQLALIPDLAGTGEILTYEFLANYGDETYLIYINAMTGNEEQILQQVQTDGGTFAL